MIANTRYIRMLLVSDNVRVQDLACDIGVHRVAVSKAINNLGPLKPSRREAVLRGVASRLRRQLSEILIDRVAA